jgi:hypothetical protein
VRTEDLIMKVPLLLAAAAASLTALAPTPAAAQLSVTIGQPVGPGWYRWHDRRVYGRGWGGPAYYDVRGPHHGWYRWNDDYYQNCSWRWVGRHRRHREWRCW